METLLSLLRAAGEPSRLRILALLAHGELTIGELTYILRQSQPRVSRHVKLLADAGLLTRYPEASWVFCRLCRHGEVGGFLSQLATHIDPEDQAFSADLGRLAHIRQERHDKASKYFSDNAENWTEVQALYVPEIEIEKQLARYLPAGKIERLIDLGTGTGRMLELFGGQVEEGIGFDLNPQMLSLARARLSSAALDNCQVRQADIAALPLPALTADAVLIHQVLHFLDHPELVIREVSRILRHQGQVLIADFAPHGKEWLRDEHAHRRLGFTDAEINQWLEGNNLKLKDTKRMRDQQKSDGVEVVLWVAEKC